jgi:hypothetical protein
MAFSRVPAVVAAALALVSVIVACGSDGGADPGSSGGSSSGSSGSSSGSSGEGSSGTIGGDGGGADGAAPELVGCATETKKAVQKPLDLYVMLDTSSSMFDQVVQGTSKYTAVTAALNAFATDPGSAKIGLGLQFFPNKLAGTPASCTTNAQCGASAPCSANLCSTSGAFCTVKADCGATGGNCNPAGRCSLDPNFFCKNIGAACAPDVNGFDKGTCAAQTTAECQNTDTCVTSDYSTPALAIAELPAAASAFAGALAARTPHGNTPTLPALQGAVDAAKAYATAHPGHTVVVVFATDGLPTTCDTDLSHITAVASGALAGTPSITTYVIGEFSPAETTGAKSVLDAIASAGGSKQAYFVTTGATTTQLFVDAMNAIRGTALPCEYDVPVPATGAPDFDRINVQHTAPSNAKTVFPNRGGAPACDAVGGWYYDVDPKVGTPTKIVLCPTTCDALKTAGGQVDVVLGCKTEVR